MFHYLQNLFSSKKNKELEILIKNSFLVDVRSPTEFSNGHVKGSVNIPLDQIELKLDSFKGKGSIIVFCASGMRSSQAKRILESKGFKNVTNGKTWKSINQYVKH